MPKYLHEMFVNFCCCTFYITLFLSCLDGRPTGADPGFCVEWGTKNAVWREARENFLMSPLISGAPPKLARIGGGARGSGWR